MKFQIKKLIAVLLCTFIFCNLFVHTQANGGNEDDIYSQVSIFRSILDNFIAKGVNSTLKTTATTDDGSAEPDVVFPESFGGHYYEENKLNICLTISKNELSKSSLVEDEKMFERISAENVRTKQVKYSFNHLKYVQMLLGESEISAFGVTSTDLDVVSNSIVLNLYSQEAINRDKLIDYLRTLKVDLGMIQINISDTKPELLLPNESDHIANEDVPNKSCCNKYGCISRISNPL